MVSGVELRRQNVSISPELETWVERRQAQREAINIAYGLLWHMRIDRRDDNLLLASEARKMLLATMDKGDQAEGISRAKAEFPQPQRRDGKEPCGECHLQVGEVCDICGAVQPVD
jgi:hypothetical protein